MDGMRFDQAVKSLATSTDRRRALGALLVGSVGAVLSWQESTAKRQRGAKRQQASQPRCPLDCPQGFRCVSSGGDPSTAQCCPRSRGRQGNLCCQPE